MPTKHPLVRTFGAQIKCPKGTAEDRNLNEICIRKAIKCHHLNMVVGVLRITAHDRYS
jgi:hypothetical protein